MVDLKELNKECEVNCNSLKEFCEKYHKRKYEGEEKIADYEAHEWDMRHRGYTIIPHHDSITGETVSYYGKI